MKIRATLISFALAATCANAAVVATYSAGVAPTAGTTGASDPTSQGWTANGGATSFSHGLDSTNGGWRITDGTSSQPFFYQTTIAAADATAMGSGDWTATWTTAVNADAVNSGGGGVDNFYNAGANQNDNAMWIEVSGSFRYILTYGADANNDITLSDGTSTFQITTANNQLSQELGAGAPTANYVTYTLDSVAGVVSLTDSLGGVHGAIAASGGGTQDRVVWGAVSSGGMGSTTWNAIDISTVPEPTAAALFGLGALGLILRRRRK